MSKILKSAVRRTGKSLNGNGVLQSAVIEVTSACPLSCFSCYVPQRAKMMTAEDFDTIIQKLPQVEHIIISGGEPFANHRLLKMVELVRDRKRTLPDVFTSGHIIPPNMAEFAGKVNSIRVSVKYTKDDLDDEWRGVAGSFSNTRNFARLAQQNKIPLAFHHVIGTNNALYILDMLDFADEYKAEPIFLPFISYDKSHHHLMLPKEKWDGIAAKLRKKGCEVEMVEDVCVAGFKRCAIDAHGFVRSCVYAPPFSAVGNILHERWSLIHERMKQQRLQMGDLPPATCPVYDDAINKRWKTTTST